MPGYIITRQTDRLVVTTTRSNLAGKSLALLLILALFGGCLRIVFMAILFAMQMPRLGSGAERGILFVVGGVFTAFLLFCAYGFTMALVRSFQPLIFDRGTGRFSHGKRDICPLGSIFSVHIVREYVYQQGHRYGVILCLTRGTMGLYRLDTFVRREQAAAFAQPIAEFVGRQVSYNET